MKRYYLTVKNMDGNIAAGYLVPEHMVVSAVEELVKKIFKLGWTFEFELIDKKSWDVLAKHVSMICSSEHKFVFI